MALPPHIISWGGNFNERSISPVSSITTSVLSFDSVLSNPLITSPTFSSLPNSCASQSRPKSINFPQFPGSKAASGMQKACDGTFIRHDKYFFKDGNITFLVGGTLYCVHRYFSPVIRSPIVISLGDIESKDFEAFLSVIYPENFEDHDLSYEQWKSVLHLSTCWGFTSLRNLALKSIKPPTPFDQLLLARTYSVDCWVLPALSALCERKVPLSLSEARQMSINDVVLVTAVREDIRHHALQVDPEEIPRCIEAAQAGMLAVAAGDGTSPSYRPKSESTTSPSTSGTERAPGSTEIAANSSSIEAENDDDAKTAVAVSLVDVRRGAKEEDGPEPNARLATVRASRPAPARGKILVVPSPVTPPSPRSSAWGSDVGNTQGRSADDW
ncbi:hypothetical protein B0F90DRAFT_1713914 [Multifurca ochricompacta]|uniref:BTB domain-containing protein n=1 Tax=Multifurca ochricompacta TaxID=376703 RepID=A0AAD4QLL7_9AGAM|nr:hypothetical protein B0F90DRAFT_1713914 [Multifurca ochricompacta]